MHSVCRHSPFQLLTSLLLSVLSDSRRNTSRLWRDIHAVSQVITPKTKFGRLPNLSNEGLMETVTFDVGTWRGATIGGWDRLLGFDFRWWRAGLQRERKALGIKPRRVDLNQDSEEGQNRWIKSRVARFSSTNQTDARNT